MPDQQRDMLAGHLIGAESDDLGVFGTRDRQPRPADDAQPVSIFVRVDIGGRDRF